MYHLKLIKALSYSGIVEATQKNPDVFVNDKSIANAAVSTGYFKLLESGEASARATETLADCFGRTRIEEMKLDDLKQIAADMNIDTTGFKKKSDYIEAIAAVEATSVPEDNEVDYGEGSPTMVDLQEA